MKFKLVLASVLVALTTCAMAGKSLSPEMLAASGYVNIPTGAVPVGIWELNRGRGKETRAFVRDPRSQKIYMTSYFSDGTGGDHGEELRPKGSTSGQVYVSKTADPKRGEFYKIEKNGRLSIFDKSGLVDDLAPSATLRP